MSNPSIITDESIVLVVVSGENKGMFVKEFVPLSPDEQGSDEQDPDFIMLGLVLTDSYEEAHTLVCDNEAIECAKELALQASDSSAPGMVIRAAKMSLTVTVESL